MPHNRHSAPVRSTPAALRAVVLVAATTSVVSLVTPAASAHSRPTAGVRLLADTDRDGRITAADAPGKGAWTDRRGAIVLPNIDDNGKRCRAVGSDGKRLSDDALAGCNDASDEIVNGPEDARDLAPLRLAPLTTAGPDARATVTVDAASRPYARLFIREDDGTHTLLPRSGRLTRAQLRDGVDLALEARDIVRDPRRWNGMIDVSVRVTDGGRTVHDRVRARVAPLLLTHDLLPAERVVTSDNGSSVADAERTPHDPERPARHMEKGEKAFRDELRAGLAAAGVNDRLLEYPTRGREEGDRWMRDHFTTGYVAAPGADGTVRRKKVFVRAPGMVPGASTPEFPLRESGRPLFSVFRGPGTGAVQEYDAAHIGDEEHNKVWGSFSSTGNFITAPPYRTRSGAWPSGRILYGSDGANAAPDTAFLRMLTAQGAQDPLAVDTSWLGVGHIDEFLSFVPADNARGWAVMVADPRLGMRLLKEVADAGGGDKPLVRGVAPKSTPHPGLTVQEALRLPELRAGTKIAERGTDGAIRVLSRELGLKEKDFVRVPALFGRLDLPGWPRQDVVSNYLPAVVNGIETGTGTFLAAKPHAPADAAGRDVFQKATERALARVGGTVAWVEDWDYGHGVGTVGGELHCVTNVLRDVSGAAPWWRATRRTR